MRDLKQRIRIRFFSTIRQLIQKKEDVIELSGEITVVKLLKHLSEKYDLPFFDYINHRQGRIKLHFQLLVNGRNIATLQDLNTKLTDGDEVALVPPVGGG